MISFHHDFGARTDNLPIFEVEIRHVGRGIHQPERSIEIKSIALIFRGELLRNHDLEDVACGDVLFGSFDRIAVVFFRKVADDRAIGGAIGIPVELTDAIGDGLV